MRFLKLTILTILLNACGLAEPFRRSSHEESQTYSNNFEPAAAFHSVRGWPDVIAYYIVDNAPQHVVDSTLRAAASWNRAIGRDLLIFAGKTDSPRGSSLYASLDDEATVIYFEKNWKATTGKGDITLATTVWENDGKSDAIVKGDIILNAEKYNFVDSLAPEFSRSFEASIVDAETVLAHEFGHLIGLDHIEFEDDPYSVMHARTLIGPALSSREPSESDISNIRTLYP